MARFGYSKASCSRSSACWRLPLRPTPKHQLPLRKLSCPASEQPRPVAGKSSLYCAGYIQYQRLPRMPEIVGAEEEQEQRMFADGDVVYLNAGSQQGIKEGQNFQIIRPRGDVKGVHKQKFGFPRNLRSGRRPTSGLQSPGKHCGRADHFFLRHDPARRSAGADSRSRVSTATRRRKPRSLRRSFR